MCNPTYEAKVARLAAVDATVTSAAGLRTRDWIIDDLIAGDYGATPVGSFENVDRIVGKAAERNVEGPWTTIGTLLDQFTLLERANFFGAAGYKTL